VIDENKVLASVTNTTNKVLTFYVLNPVVNGQPYFKSHLNNATYVSEQGVEKEICSEPTRDRSRKNPYFTGNFPTGYVSGNENFYPMKLKAGETKTNLVMIKQDLDGMVLRGLVTYVAAQTRANAKVRAVNTDLSVHGVNIALGKTVFLELSDEVQTLVTSGDLVIVP
jgi:hypothetical protein